MAMESQGVQIRRASTTLVTSTYSAVTATAVLDAGSGLGAFTTDMMIALSSLSTVLHPIKSVAATVVAIHGSFIAAAQGVAVGVVTGYSMNLIGEITDFTGPGGAAAIIDVTNVQSTAKEKLVGLRDEGQVSLGLNFNATDTGQLGLISDRAARQKNRYAMIFTDSATSATSYPSFCFFNGYAMNYSISGAVDNKISANAVIEIDGPVIWSTKSTAA